jgi:hypothetical protein
VRLIVVCLAFAPVVWQHSAETIDYLWSLLFILFSWLMLERRRSTLAGVLLAIAVGFRPSNSVAIVPMLAFSYLEKQERREQLKMCMGLGVVALPIFLPLIMRYGIVGWVVATRLQMSDILPQTIGARLIAFGYRSIYFIGPVTAILAAIVLVRARSAVVQTLRAREPMIVAATLGIVAFLALFFSLPLERAYLLPAFPFFLLVLDRFASRTQFTLFTATLVLSGLINLDVISHENRRAAGFNVRWGIVIEELQLRNDLLDARRRIASLHLPDNSIVMTGGGPTLWLDNDALTRSPRESELLDTSLPGYPHFEGHRRVVQKKENPTVLFTMYLTPRELERARDARLSVYCLQSAQKYVELQTGYPMQDAGVTVIADR